MALSEKKRAYMRAYLARRKALGLCVSCGESVFMDSRYCSRCLYRRRTRARIQHGTKPWQPGCRGRPPKERQAAS